MCTGEGATALVGWLRVLTGWRRVGAAFLAGLASALAFAPTHLAPLLFLTFPILLTLLDQDDVLQSARERMTRGFAAAWAFGFGYHLVGLHWIGHAFLVQADIFAWALPFAVTLLPAGLAIFFGLAGVVVTLTPARALWRPVAFVLAFATAEWLRSVILTGFPWNVIGYALAWPLELMQAFAVVGLHGLTLMTLTLAVAPFLVWRRLGRDPERTALQSPQHLRQPPCRWLLSTALALRVSRRSKRPNCPVCGCVWSSRASTRPRSGSQINRQKFFKSIST
jgi:apolipoprotein N-acyltransferase